MWKVVTFCFKIDDQPLTTSQTGHAPQVNRRAVTTGDWSSDPARNRCGGGLHQPILPQVTAGRRPAPGAAVRALVTSPHAAGGQAAPS